MYILGIKNWNVSVIDKTNAQKIACENNIPFFLAMMLDIRHIVSKGNITEFLSENVKPSDPFDFIDMDKAVDRIKFAIENFERICVYGDYDADGVTSTALLYSYLQNCDANVVYYIPNRNDEGYGMNKKAIDKLFNDGVKLIVTVDNGISAYEEIKYATSLGIDTVVTDHHQPPDILPEAVAIVDPHRLDCKSTFKDFAGVGVTFKLICAMEGDMLDTDLLLENYSDLILIGTIGDIVPLIGENRYLVKKGLDYINITDKYGVREILSIAKLNGKPICSTNVTFNIVPRINAAGRLSSADKLVKLLISEDKKEAEYIATQVEKENVKRKEIEAEILLQVEELLKKEPKRLYQRVLIVEGENWHPGVIGIVAAKLLERYGKPTVVISLMGDVARGSGRSIEGFSLYENIKACSSYLLRFGGHPLAAGFELKREDLCKLKEDIIKFAESCEKMPYPELNIACKLNPLALNIDLIGQLLPLEPFGKDNPEFIFGLYNMMITGIVPVGDGNHLRVTFKRDGTKITAMKFFTTFDEFSYAVGDCVDVAVKLSKSEYKNQECLTIIIEDIKFSSIDNKTLIDEMRLYEEIKLDKSIDIKMLGNNVPKREDFSAFYRWLKSQGPISMDISVLYYRLRELKINMCKLLIMLDALEECKLISINTSAGRYDIKLEDVNGKVDLESSLIMRNLRKRDDTNESIL